MFDFRRAVFTDEAADIMQAVSYGLTAGAYASVRWHTQLLNRLSLIQDVMVHYRTHSPWLPTLQMIEDYNESQDDEWSAWMDTVTGVDRNRVLGLYLEVCSDWFFVRDLFLQLDINNTIDHVPRSFVTAPPSGYQREFLDERYVSDDPYQCWTKYLSNCSARAYRQRHGLERLPAKQDDISRFVTKMSYASRRSTNLQRLHNAIDLADKAGWYMVFDTLTISDEKAQAFAAEPMALRDHFRNVATSCAVADILRFDAKGNPYPAGKGPSIDDVRVTHARERAKSCFQYFCVPEHGTETNRLHFHVLYMMRSLPLGTRDPNLGRSAGNATLRQLNSMLYDGYRPPHMPSLSIKWPYGQAMPFAVRYEGDAYSRAGWRWPVDKNGKAIPKKPCKAVAFYVTKYVNKMVDFQIDSKGLNGGGVCQNPLALKIQEYGRTFRVRMSRGLGLQAPPMEHFTNHQLVQICMLSYKSFEKTKILKHNACKLLKSRLGTLTHSELQDAKPTTTNLLAFLRNSTETTLRCKLASFIAMLAPRLQSMDVSDEVYDWALQHSLVKVVRPAGECS